MSGRANGVLQARMHAQVGLLATLWLLFLAHVHLMLVVDELDNGRPRVTVVDVVAKAKCVDDCQLDLELLLFKLSLDDLDLSELVKLVCCICDTPCMQCWENIMIVKCASRFCVST